MSASETERSQAYSGTKPETADTDEASLQRHHRCGWASPVFVDIRASASKRLESPWRNGREESLRTSSRPTR